MKWVRLPLKTFLLVHQPSCFTYRITHFVPPSPPSLLQESEFDHSKQPDSPQSEEEPSTPRALQPSQNPKYQLFLTNGMGGREEDRSGGGGGGGGSLISVGENGFKSRFDSIRPAPNNHYKGSLESLASRDWDTGSDRVGETHRDMLCVCYRDDRDFLY